MVTGILVFIHICLSALLMTLVFMHSGQDAGLGSMGGGGGGGAGTGGGGQHIMERNLDRATVIVAILFAATSVALGYRF